MSDTHSHAPTEGGHDKKEANKGGGFWGAIRKYKFAVAAALGLGGGVAAENNTVATLGTAAAIASVGGAHRRTERYANPIAAGIASVALGPVAAVNGLISAAGTAGALAAGAEVARRGHQELYGEDKKENLRRLKRAAEHERDEIDAAAGRAAALLTSPDIAWAPAARGGSAPDEGAAPTHSGAHTSAEALEHSLHDLLEHIEHSPYWKATDGKEEKSDKKVHTLAATATTLLNNLVAVRGGSVTIRGLNALQKTLDGLLTAMKKGEKAAAKIEAENFETEHHYAEEVKTATETTQGYFKKGTAAALLAGTAFAIPGTVVMYQDHVKNVQEERARLPEEVKKLKAEKAALEAELKALESKDAQEKTTDTNGNEMTVEARRIQIRKYLTQIESDLKKKEQALEVINRGKEQNETKAVAVDTAPDMNAQKNHYEGKHPTFEFRAARKGDKLYLKLGGGLNKATARVDMLTVDGNVVHLNPVMNESGDTYVVNLTPEMAKGAFDVACSAVQSGQEFKTGGIKIPK